MKNQNEVSRELAAKMAKLTCSIAKNCNKKENYFAASFNLTPAEFRCLRLFTVKQSLSIKTLTTELELTPGRITHILTSLEEKKLITRSIDPKDKRNVIVTLTEKSRPFIKQINETHIEVHKELLTEISPEQRTIVLDAMEDVIRALKNWTNKNE